MGARFHLMSFLEQIEPLKQAAIADLRAAPDLGALEQAKGAYLGPQEEVHGFVETIARRAAQGRKTRRRQTRQPSQSGA